MNTTTPTTTTGHQAAATEARVPLHRCRAVGCQHDVKTSFLMCIDHWRLVPKKVREQVLATYRQRRRGAAAFGAYLTAVQAAVDAVHGKQVQRRAKQDAQTPPLF